jgi:hypothetical protein
MAELKLDLSSLLSLAAIDHLQSEPDSEKIKDRYVLHH